MMSAAFIAIARICQCANLSKCVLECQEFVLIGQVGLVAQA